MARNSRGEQQPGTVVWDDSALVREMDAVKRLLMLLLVKLGSTSEEIASALDVDASVVRRAVPSRKVKKLPIGNGREEE